MADVLFPNIQPIVGIEPLHLGVLLGLQSAGNEVETAADRHYWVNTQREIFVVYNSTGSAITLTFTTQPKRDGRVQSTAQSVFSIAAGVYTAFGPFPNEGWADASAQIYVVASAVGLRGVVLRLPAVA